MCHDLSKPFINALDNLAESLSSLPNSLMIIRSKQEMMYDNRFLEGLPNLMKDNGLGIQCPLIQSRRRSPDESYYGKDTCMEFHQLLCRLLHVFKESLSELSKLSKANKMWRPPIDKLVDRILLFGTTLWEISNGSAIRQHLQDTSPLLEKAYKKIDDDIPTGTTEDGNTEVEDLEGIQPFVMMSGRQL